MRQHVIKIENVSETWRTVHFRFKNAAIWWGNAAFYPSKDGSIHISHIEVRKDFRGQKLGYVMLQKIIDLNDTSNYFCLFPMPPGTHTSLKKYEKQKKALQRYYEGFGFRCEPNGFMLWSRTTLKLKGIPNEENHNLQPL